MALHNDIGILLVIFVAVTLSLQDDCGDSFYGTCDPGPNCENLDPLTNDLKCYSCSDGGFWPFESQCDGVIDCNNGMDEKNCEVYDIQSKVTSCLSIFHYCKHDGQCCSGNCDKDITGLRTVGMCNGRLKP